MYSTELYKLESWKMTVCLHPQTKETRKARMNHLTSMFHLFGGYLEDLPRQAMAMRLDAWGQGPLYFSSWLPWAPRGFGPLEEWGTYGGAMYGLEG